MYTSITTNGKQKRKRIAIGLAYLLSAFGILGAWSVRAQAQEQQHSHGSGSQQQTMTPEQQNKAGALIKLVRDATERYKDVTVAEADGYALQFGCVTGPDSGAMGLHYVNSQLVNNGMLDPYHPQIVIYEPKPGGGLRLIGADYLLMAEPWDKKGIGPPQLMGQLFHYFETPNRFGLPAFYTLHVWAWKENPNGAFVNWHPKVNCEHFSDQTTQ